MIRLISILTLSLFLVGCGKPDEISYYKAQEKLTEYIKQNRDGALSFLNYAGYYDLCSQVFTHYESYLVYKEFAPLKTYCPVIFETEGWP